MACVPVDWPVVVVVALLTAPRLAAELRNGWHSADLSTGSEAESDS